jgi:hypothetical protein
MLIFDSRTAAHCFTDRKNPKIYLLNGHNYTRNDNYKIIKYDHIFIHPKYQEYSGTHEFSTNDIALIKVAPINRFKKNIVRPCLPKQNAIIPPNSICYITGKKNIIRSMFFSLFVFSVMIK